MPDVPNPIGAVGTALGNAAASSATNAIDEAGERIWQFALLLLSGSFDLLARFAAITSAGLAFLAILVAAADGLATGLLASGRGADSFGELADRNTSGQDAAQSAAATR